MNWLKLALAGVVVLIVITNTSEAVGRNEEAKGFGFEEGEIEVALQSGSDFSGTTNGPLDVELPYGGTATVEGDVEVSGGQISADHLIYNDGIFSEVRGFVGSGDGFQVESVERLEMIDSVLSNARGVQFDEGRLNADYAEGYKVGETRLTLADGISSDGTQVRVEGADLLSRGDVTVMGIPSSVVTIGNETLKIDPEGDAEFAVRDGSGRDVRFAGNGSVSVTTERPYIYEINNGTLSVNGTDFAEVVEANVSAVATVSSAGVDIAVLQPGSGYHYLAPSLVQDFVLHNPRGSKGPYRVCLRRDKAIRNGSVCDAVVDMVNRTLRLGGVIDYRRYPIGPTGIADLVTQLVYQGRDPNTIARIQLDAGLLYIDSLIIENRRPVNAGVIASTRVGYYTVYERFDGINVTRFGRFNDDPSPDLVKVYRSKFGVPKPEIGFINQTMVQAWPSPVGINGTVTAICAKCPDIFAAKDSARDVYLSFETDPRWCPRVS